MTEKNIYQFKVDTIKGEEVSLKNYEGKVLMIVNTASECGFTPQLEDLEQLRKDFEGEKFEILAFPSNDFGQQEPLEGDAISKFCVINYHTHFTIFKKMRVRGTYASPLYKFLSDKKLNGHVNASPRWNFHKYLINSKGEVIDYFYPFTKPNSAKVKKAIQKLLSTTKKD
ncbi:glutathione peroxidase [Pedobacter cryophilus]|jgi:glutathione peroxidase|uniref:Glutathione peroxidase n=1 Tax=Pedobacter cryophilus TaxID=2571271 RepID=A0A4U1BXE3_9SPHI|nr:glutathione peroxidase [Pedobacter cryophilus]TKB97011.1 glutathione peroxidase [Pedobacter cryophilus]